MSPPNKKNGKEDLNEYEQLALSYHQDSFNQSKKPASKATSADYYEKKNTRPGNTKANVKPISMGGYDNLVPDVAGQVVDSVFGKLDSFVNKVLGEDPPKAKKKVVKNPKVSQWGTGTVKRDYDEDDFNPRPKQVIRQEKPPAPPPVKTQVQTRTIDPNAPKEKVEYRPAPAVKEDRSYEPILSALTRAKMPTISRTTPIAELDLPYSVLSDPDLVKYFDQMKLYEYNIIEGGLCNMPMYQAINFLRKGVWGEEFNLSFPDLKISLGMKPADIAKSRYRGMLPVYKAYGWKFRSMSDLKKAIEADIDSFLSTGTGNPVFHKFTYKIVVKKST